MDYIRLGKTDMKVSRVGLGVWQFDENASSAASVPFALLRLVRALA